MRQLVITLIIMVTTDLNSGQYPDCVSCSGGSIPLSPLSYSTEKLNVFRETQPSNDECTHEKQRIINCGQGATLIDCDQGVSVGDYSDLTSFFTWNRAESAAQQVSIEFRFDQEVNISNIRMFFWNSPSDSIIVPNNIIMQFTTYEISMINNRTDNGQNVLNIDSSNDRLLFKVLRIEMRFYNDSEWIFLSEVQFCGNIAPFHITQPSTDNHVQVVNSTTTQVSLTCSLNVTISSTVITSWRRNGTGNALPGSSHTGDTATLLITNFQPSDAGVYQCVFNDQLGSGWTIKRNIILMINDSATSSTTNISSTGSYMMNTSATASSAMDMSATTTTTVSIPFTATTTTTVSIPFTATTTVTTTSTNSTISASSGDSDNVGIIVAPIIVVIVVIIIVVAIGLIILFFWRKKQKSYQVSDDDVEFTKKLSHESANIKSNNGKTSKSKNTQYNTTKNPPLIYAVPDNDEKKNHLAISQDLLINGETVELDIYGTVQGHAKNNTMVDNPIYNLEENRIYDEAISPAAIISGLSHDESSLYENIACPLGSIYDDPMPLVKSEGPPIVSGKNIKLLHPLGVGQFGEVMLAKTVELSSRYLGIGNSNDKSIPIKVAIKTLKSASSEESRKSFEKEIKFMSRLKDDNVVRVLAICTTGTPFIVMEYMENGDLNNYLQKFKFTHKSDKLPAANEITLNALIYVSFQIASGMEYLSSHKFIHRDLAARNVLVGVNYTVKIADFGMSQNMYSAYYCRITGRKVLPIRWMAHESFFGKFSIQTDVWSFGITLWEIFTLCRERPFDDLTDQELIEDAIKGAGRKIPGQPDVCPNEVYVIMKSCLQHEPSERAKFNLLCDQLNEFYTKLL